MIKEIPMGGWFDDKRIERIERTVDQIQREQQKVDYKLDLILRLLKICCPHRVASIVITQEGEDKMSVTQGPLTGIVAGQSALLTANLFDPNGNPVTDPAIIGLVTLVWTSADTTNMPVSSSGTAGDLTAVCSPPAGATVGATASVSVAFVAPLADGSNPTGAATETVLTSAPPPPPPVAVAQIIITQT